MAAAYLWSSASIGSKTDRPRPHRAHRATKPQSPPGAVRATSPLRHAQEGHGGHGGQELPEKTWRGLNVPGVGAKATVG